MPPVYREVGINPALVWPALALAAFVGWKCLNLATPRQRRFQFGLRAIFVVMTLVGCWLAYELHWIRARREILDRGQVRLVMHSSGWLVRTPPWPLPWLGEQSPQAAELALFPTASDEQLSQVRFLFPEMRVTRDSD